MGEVYAAYHPDLDRRIALKVVRGSGPQAEKQNALLLPEARAVARLSHPNVVAVFDAGTDGDGAYIAMEFIPGRRLDGGSMSNDPLEQELSTLVKAGRGLGAAHARAGARGLQAAERHGRRQGRRERRGLRACAHPGGGRGAQQQRRGRSDGDGVPGAGRRRRPREANR